MMHYLKQFMSQPYPAPHPNIGGSLWILLLGAGVTSLLIFLPTFEHLNNSLFARNFLLICGLVATTSGLFMRTLLPALFPNFFDESKWTVVWEIAFELIYLQVIAASLLFVAFRFDLFELSIRSYFTYVVVTGIFGIIPLAFKVLVTTNLLLKRNLQALRNAPQIEHQLIPKDQKILLKAITQNKFEVLQSNLIAISAQQNYSDIIYIDEGEVNYYLLRQSIAALEKQLENTNMLRCHRSHIINKSMVDRITGNAQGYSTLR